MQLRNRAERMNEHIRRFHELENGPVREKQLEQVMAEPNSLSSDRHRSMNKLFIYLFFVIICLFIYFYFIDFFSFS